jgi:2-methylcitrate dehydratase PrpD
LHNGCLGNVLEMDDVDKRAVLHAAPTVIPAALAVAQAVQASVAAFLEAVTIGYEATIRIGRAVGAGHYAYWHNTATCGPFGAAAAACHLIPGSDIVSALGLAGTQAAGLWQTRHEPSSMAKQLHAGHAAHAGVLAAMLSAQGFHGPRTILEGEQGFFAAMCPQASPKDILADYGDHWLHTQTSFKPYPACRHAHPTIDAALKLKQAGGYSDGEDIIIETYGDALKFCDKPNPETLIESKFSLQHSAAVALSSGVPTLADFTPGRIKDLAKLRSRISVRASAEITARYPHHYGAEIIHNGSRFVAKDAYGDPENPMSKKAVLEKAKTLMIYGGMQAQAVDQLCSAVTALPQGGELSTYLRLLP